MSVAMGLNLHLAVRLLIFAIALSWIVIPMLQQWGRRKPLAQ